MNTYKERSKNIIILVKVVLPDSQYLLNISSNSGRRSSILKALGKQAEAIQEKAIIEGLNHKITFN